MKEKSSFSGTNLVLGMAAGAAVSAAGMYFASQNEREIRRTAKKMAAGAEHAVMRVDKMLEDFSKHRTM